MMPWRSLRFTLALIAACSGAEEDLAAPLAPAPVTVVELSLAPFQRRFEANGLAEARHQATVMAEGSGRVVARVAEVGQRVREGEALVRLESGRQATAVQAAEATLAKARALLDDARRRRARATQLGDALSPADHEAAALGEALAAADLLAAEAGLAAQRRAFADTVLRAPFDGVVSRHLLDRGQLVGPGTPGVGVVDADVLRVRLGLPPSQAAALKVGDAARVQAPGVELVGEVHELALEVDRATGTVPVEVRAPNPDLALLPNTPVTVVLQEAEGASALAIPRDAVQERFGEPVAFVVEGEAARLRRLSLGEAAGGRVAVTAGLSPGERLVVVGAAGLTDGAAVRVVED